MLFQHPEYRQSLLECATLDWADPWEGLLCLAKTAVRSEGWHMAAFFLANHRLNEYLLGPHWLADSYDRAPLIRAPFDADPWSLTAEIQGRWANNAHEGEHDGPSQKVGLPRREPIYRPWNGEWAYRDVQRPGHQGQHLATGTTAVQGLWMLPLDSVLLFCGICFGTAMSGDRLVAPGSAGNNAPKVAPWQADGAHIDWGSAGLLGHEGEYWDGIKGIIPGNLDDLCLE